jgi:hypothetical protein
MKYFLFFLVLTSCASSPAFISTHITKCYQRCYAGEDGSACQSLCVEYDKEFVADKNSDPTPPNKDTNKGKQDPPQGENYAEGNN